MGAWMHAEERRSLPWPYDGLEVCDVAGCVCVIPTPDPASPCGYVGCFQPDDQGPHLPCPVDIACGLHREWVGCHPRQPTRCTCGHTIEAVR